MGSPKEELEGVFAGAKEQKQKQEQEVVEEIELDEPKPEVVVDQQ